MKEWFKARNIWGAAITALTDEEAGRVAKAIWSFTMNGEITEIEGAGKGILAMILMTLGQDEERDAEISFKRSMATAGIRNQKKSDDGKSHQMISNDIKCNQLISNDDNKNKNKNKEQESETETEIDMITAEDAEAIQHDHDRILDAAEDAGFKMSNDVRATLIALYAENGLQKMLDGFKACVDHGVSNIAYLKGCLKGEPRKSQGKTVSAQQYAQRSYENEDAEAMRRMLKVVNSP